MTNWKKYILVAVIMTAAGFGYIKNSHGNIPADLRDAVADNGKFDTSIPVFDKNSGNIPEPKAAVVDRKTSATVDPKSVDDASDSGITYSKGFQVVAAERNRAEQALRAVKSKFGDDTRKDQRLAEAWNRYSNAKAKLSGWIAVFRFGLVAGDSNASDAEKLLQAARLSEDFISYAAELTGLQPPEGLLKKLGKSGIKKWHKEIRKAYKSASSEEKDKILNAISSLSWKFFEEVELESSSNRNKGFSFGDINIDIEDGDISITTGGEKCVDCGVFGCWPKGGGCNPFGCWKAGGKCDPFGCIKESSCKK